MGNVGRPTAVYGIELQQMAMHRGITNGVVDPGKVCTAFQQWAQRQFAYTAKAIERVGGHDAVSMEGSRVNV